MPDETRLLEKRRQAFEAQEALDQRRAEYSQQEVIFKQREDALRAKDLELQASLTKFARFLQEADARRARALRKASEESRVAAQADARCHEVQRQLDSLEQQRTTINTLLQKRMQYQRYLESVLEALQHAGQELDMPDLLRRHATLTTNLDTLSTAQQHADARTETRWAQHAQRMQEHHNQVLTLNNTMSHLRAQLQAARVAVGARGASHAAAMARANQATLEHDTMVTAIEGMFLRCRSASCVAHHEGLSLVDKLRVLRNFVGDLGAAVKKHGGDLGAGKSKGGGSE